jgi:hypothetical protein
MCNGIRLVQTEFFGRLNFPPFSPNFFSLRILSFFLVSIVSISPRWRRYGNVDGLPGGQFKKMARNVVNENLKRMTLELFRKIFCKSNSCFSFLSYVNKCAGWPRATQNRDQGVASAYLARLTRLVMNDLVWEPALNLACCLLGIFHLRDIYSIQ